MKKRFNIERCKYKMGDRESNKNITNAVQIMTTIELHRLFIYLCNVVIKQYPKNR